MSSIVIPAPDAESQEGPALVDDAVDEQSSEEELEVASLLLATAPPPLPTQQQREAKDVDMDKVSEHVAEPPTASLSTQSHAKDATLMPPPPAPGSPAQTLTSDIEHILSLGANEPDEAPLHPRDYESVVRDLKERAGFRVDAKDGGGLDGIEKEMEAEGIRRGEEDSQFLENDQEAMQVQKEDVKPEVPEAAPSIDKPTTKALNDSDSDSDSSSSSSSSSAASTASRALDTSAPAGRRRIRGKRPVKPSADSDLSDDDVNTGSAPTTAHEIPAPIPELPSIQKLSDDTSIAPFGKVESLVETVVVIKADTAGDYRVLDEGTVVCWEDKTVVGTIFETFGAVSQPFYALRFPANAAPSPDVFRLKRPIYYAPSGASFVFTRELKHLKGSDASNLYDEEVGANEMEWSDDEAEQAYKRNMKADRRSRTATPGASSAQSARAGSARPGHLPPRPSVQVGSEPPHAGQQMFERDTGTTGAGDEFEFSDDDAGPPPAFVAAPRGDENGRGRGARGRGGPRGRGRGRGDHQGPDAGRGRNGDERREVAPLPNRPGAGLPPRPNFDSGPLPPGSSSGPSQEAYNPIAPHLGGGNTSFDFRPPTSYPSPSQQSSYPHQQQHYPSQPDYRQHDHHAQQYPSSDYSQHQNAYPQQYSAQGAYGNQQQQQGGYWGNANMGMPFGGMQNPYAFGGQQGPSGSFYSHQQGAGFDPATFAAMQQAWDYAQRGGAGQQQGQGGSWSSGQGGQSGGGYGR